MILLLLSSRYRINLKRKILVIGNLVICIICAACAPNSPQGINEAKTYDDEQQTYYDKKYEKEPDPDASISDLLSLLDTCVGGQYVIGGQGDRITEDFLASRLKQKPDAFTEEQIKHLSKIARSGANSGWRFPEYYAWDCSGLWWWSCNKIGLYAKKTDCTAYITYHLYCTPISKDDLQPGDLVFYQDEDNRIVHMGIVGRQGYVYESVCVFGGVVKKRTIDERVYVDKANGGIITEPAWNVFGRPEIFE